MKSIFPRWPLILCLVIVSQPAFAQVKAMTDSGHLQKVEPTREPLFSWINSGTLYWVELESGGGYLFCDDTGQLSVMSRNWRDAASMMGLQLHSQSEAEAFIKAKLAQVMISFSGLRKVNIINEPYVQYLRNLPVAAWSGKLSEKEKHEAILHLQKYAHEALPIIDGTKWSLEYYVACKGGVEKWTLRGQIWPFNIEFFNRTQIEQSGSIIQLREMK